METATEYKPKLKPIAQKQYYETSHKQRHEWVFAHSRQGEEFLFKIRTVHYVPNLDLGVFEKAFRLLVKRHESLRTNFVTINGALMLKVKEWEQAEYCMHFFDMRRENNPDASIALVKREDFRMVNYETEPLITIQIFRISDESYAIAIYVEHIICDAMSIEIITEELTWLYTNLIKGNEEQVLRDEIQLKEYVAWKNEVINRKSNLEYWETRSRDDAYAFDFKKFYRAYGQNYLHPQKDMKGKYTFYIDEELMSRLSAVADLHHISFPSFLISVFVIFLSKLFDQKNVLVSVMFVGRETNGINRLVGNCTDFVFLFVDVNPSAGLGEMVRSIFMTFMDSLDHQYPWSDDGNWPFAGKDLFKVNYLTNSTGSINSFEPVHDQQQSMSMASTSYIEFLQYANGIEMLCKYSLYHYSKDMVAFLGGKYLNLLRNIVKHPHASVRDLKWE